MKRNRILSQSLIKIIFCCVTLLTLFSCTTTFNPKGKLKKLNEMDILMFSNIINTTPDTLKETIDKYTSHIYGDNFNYHCFSIDDESHVSKYNLINQKEEKGIVADYLIGNVLAYTCKGEIKIIVIHGNFEPPAIFNDTPTYSTFDNKVIKKVTLNGTTFYMMCYEESANPHYENFTPCGQVKLYDDYLISRNRLILFKDENVPNTIYSLKDNLMTYSQLF